MLKFKVKEVIKPDMNILERHRKDFKMIGSELNIVSRDTYRHEIINERDLRHYLDWLDDVIDNIKFNLDLK